MDGNHDVAGSEKLYYVFARLADFAPAGPSQVLVMLDEDPYSINDGAFGIDCSTPEWIDHPATYHGNAGGFNFADGHSEIHKWVDFRTPEKAGVWPSQGLTSPKPVSLDWNWVAQHASARRDGGLIGKQ